MILAIDVGNTNIVLGMIENGEIQNVVRIHTDLRETGNGVRAQAAPSCGFLSHIDLMGLEGGYHFLGRASGHGVAAARGGEPYRQKAADRRAGNEDRHERQDRRPVDHGGRPRCPAASPRIATARRSSVIDMGTATTMVLIDNEGSYRGGAIIPGIKLSYGALSSGTSLLPDIAILPPKKVIATNTVDSMRSGAVYGTAAMACGMIDRDGERR